MLKRGREKNNKKGKNRKRKKMRNVPLIVRKRSTERGRKHMKRGRDSRDVHNTQAGH